MARSSSCFRTALLLAGAALFVGCPAAKPVVGTLSGRVVNAGRPIGDGRILFENAELGAGTVIDLDAEGRFEVATSEGPGLPPGVYQVAVKPRGDTKPPTESGDLPPEALAGSAPKGPPPKNDLIPEHFHGLETSGLKIEIKAGPNAAWDIDLGR